MIREIGYKDTSDARSPSDVGDKIEKLRTHMWCFGTNILTLDDMTIVEFQIVMTHESWL